ncbi:MAG: phosphate ABC transporter substrate-binding protein PstS [Candidatus Verstraetearchaeota archaeon]|nr:phosphate ABC transporter substrate-binding protein PstS [Candidatus Verstraetearchaeota archaeon]
MSKLLVAGILVLVLAAAVVVYYTQFMGSEQPATITAGGASFPYPLISKWASEYNKLHPVVQITYQSVGSGAGQNGLFAKTFDFAGSDAPLKDSQIAENPGILHIPETGGGIVVAYNIPGIGTGMNLTADLIAKIFQGNITKWNHPEIAAVNPALALPDLDIVVVRRSDSSGTTNGFTSYLKNASTLWVLGSGTTVNWPVGLGASGNSGVASTLQQTPGGVGYLEFFYAKNNSIPYAKVMNRAGKFVEPTLSSISAALGAAAPLLASDIRASVVNMPGDDVYPISIFTYILVYKDLSYMDEAKAKAVANFLWWIVHDGQKYSEELLYPRLPSSIVTIAEQNLRQLTYNGRPLL